MRLAVLLFLALSLPAFAHDDEAVQCGNCKAWNQPQKPFRLYGNAYYVGTTELSAVLIAGPDGHVLIDAPLPQSAPLIAASIRELGFKVEDIKLILNSHEHYDHAGGISAMQRMSGAQVAASPAAAKALRAGTIGPEDPQFDAANIVVVGKVPAVRVLRDGETVRVGPLALTPHFTPGHTPGSTTWTWQSCEAGRCLDLVYADSLNPISTDGFYYTGGAGQPDRSAAFRASIATVMALPCDIVVADHPGATDTLDKLARRTADNNTFIEAGGCKAYAESADKRLTARLAREQAEKAAAGR